MAVVPFSSQDPKAWQVALMEKPEQALAEYENVFTAQQGKISELDAKIQQLRATLERQKEYFPRLEVHAKGLAQQHTDQINSLRTRCENEKKAAEQEERRVQIITGQVAWFKQQYPQWRTFLETTRPIPRTAQYLDRILPLPGNI